MNFNSVMNYVTGSVYNTLYQLPRLLKWWSCKRLTCKQEVVGSAPFLGICFFLHLVTYKTYFQIKNVIIVRAVIWWLYIPDFTSHVLVVFSIFLIATTGQISSQCSVNTHMLGMSFVHTFFRLESCYSHSDSCWQTLLEKDTEQFYSSAKQ